MHTPSATQSLLALSCLFCTTLAMAEEKPALEEVVVTATRFPEKRAAIPAHVSVITAEQIRNSNAANVPDLLRSQVGITVADTTGNGRYFSVDLGGFGETAASNTLVLVDGRRINQADLSGSDWLQIPLDRVEKIEIIRGGGGSVLYGDNASGGVVNIITRSGGPAQTNAKVETGSYGTHKMHLGTSGLQGKLSYAVDTGSRVSDGYRDNSSTEAKDVGLKLNYDFNDDLALNFSTGYQKDDVGFPGGIGESELSQGVSRRATYSPNDFGKTEDYFFHGGPELHFGNDNLLAMDMSFRRRKTTNSFSGFLFQTNTETWSVAPKAQFGQKIGTFDDKLTLGLDYQSDVMDVHMEPPPITISDFSLEKADLGYYVHNELRFLDSWALTSGYRADQAQYKFAPSTPDRITLDEDAFSAGINYDLENRGNIYFNIIRSFRYPLLDEQFYYYNGSINTGMLPQRSDELQLGMHYELSKSMEGDISLYRTDTEHEIYLSPLFPAFPNINLDGKVRRNRVELSLEKQFEKFNWRGHYTWTEATLQSGTFANKEFPSVPKHKVGMTLGFTPTDELTMTMAGNFVGTQRFISDFSNEYGKQSSYFTLDAGLRYRWPKVTGFFDVTNLTGKEYSEYGVVGFSPPSWALQRAYYPSPERRFMAGISAHF